MSKLLAVTYLELFVAASLYSLCSSGLLIGAGVDLWNTACANGQFTFSPEKWEDTAPAMYPGYNSP
jgi:acetylxylan esterase